MDVYIAYTADDILGVFSSLDQAKNEAQSRCSGELAWRQVDNVRVHFTAYDAETKCTIKILPLQLEKPASNVFVAEAPRSKMKVYASLKEAQQEVKGWVRVSADVWEASVLSSYYGEQIHRITRLAMGG